MSFKSNYVALTPTVLMEPNLKVAIRLGWLDFEAGASQPIHIFFDSEIQPNKMMVPAHTRPRFVLPENPKIRAKIDPDELLPFYSEKERKLTSFALKRTLTDEILEWSMNLRSSHLPTVLSLLQEKGIEFVSDNPVEFLIDVINHLIQLDDWVGEPGVEHKTLRIRLNRDAFDTIEDFEVPPQWRLDGDTYIVGERELQS